MIDFRVSFEKPGLLVSVRNATEAYTALMAGADVIDVKEPRHGSLGAADATTIADVVKVVSDRAPVTIALGELIDLPKRTCGVELSPIPIGVSLFKVGLAHCEPLPDWRSRWHDTIAALRGQPPNSSPQPVAVAYADWRIASAPSPDDVLRSAVEAACPALLVDTWDKSQGDLLTHWSADDLSRFVKRVHSNNILVVLAGSLTDNSFRAAAGLAADLVAVRTAACDDGRDGTVSANKVGSLKRTLANVSQVERSIYAR